MSIGYGDVLSWVKAFAAEVSDNRAYLTRLDSAIGDGDHGTNMDRGMRKALERLDTVQGEDIGGALKAVGMALVSSVGGAGGPLYGTLFMQMGSASDGKSELDLAGWADAVEAGVKGVQTRGKAEPGDKTMVDALLPAAESLRQAAGEGAELGDALRRSAAAAEEGMKATIELVARKGRASYLGPRSAGHQDPGATSSYLLLKSAADVLGGDEQRGGDG
ncbi:MAG TPA: dihydroxyacetone kinase subunit DhaL [Thermoleophilaceae bacterium]|nr:dihydroxyacetone kinase subunit DhaL [Thermoleophilaceae bacterium]